KYAPKLITVITKNFGNVVKKLWSDTVKSNNLTDTQLTSPVTTVAIIIRLIASINLSSSKRGIRIDIIKNSITTSVTEVITWAQARPTIPKPRPNVNQVASAILRPMVNIDI